MPNEELDKFKREVYQQVVAMEIKLEGILAAVRALVLQASAEKPEDKLAGIDLMDPRNKLDNQKLTERGIEICYRLFDAGKTRYAVAELMGISFSGAKHRYERWMQLGGADRTPQALD